ncbi:MAG: hypothetical protein EOP58_09390 [Sphingomonadales bacterium]|nr:MAG: hypothetical protein EOP58_09390 [Sphingomonadales bacterium]
MRKIVSNLGRGLARGSSAAALTAALLAAAPAIAQTAPEAEDDAAIAKANVKYLDFDWKLNGN